VGKAQLKLEWGTVRLTGLVTTARKAASEQKARAKALARELGFEYLPRRNLSVAELGELSHERPVLVYESEGAYVISRGIRYGFHPNLARLRLANLKRGAPDKLIEALELKAGESVLDCTMGYGAEAILCAHVAGEEGRVVACEAIAEVALANALGLQLFKVQSPALQAAMKRVEVWYGDHLEWLKGLEDESFTCVYFDPFFDKPLKGSEPLEPLRALAGPEARGLRAEALEEAKRVAQRCVVVKFRKGSPLSEGKYARVVSGKGSKVAYGVYEA